MDDILSSLDDVKMARTNESMCAVMAVIEQESGYKEDPPVAGLSTLLANKIKKMGSESLTLILDKNPDILKILGEKKTHQFLVGFAAETQHLLENAQAKLQKKNLDMIVANDVTAAGAGFNADTNIVKFLYPDGIVEEVPKMSKDAVGMALLDVVRSKLKDF